MIKSNFLLEVKSRLEVKLLLLSTYDELEQEIRRIDSGSFIHSDMPVDNEILIKLRNLYFILGDKEKFNELNCEVYGYHESNVTPEYRNVTIYQEKSEHSSVPDGKHSIHYKDKYEKVDEYICHLPIIKIYEKSKDEHIRKDVQKYIYQTVLSDTSHYILNVFEEYFEEV